MSRIFAEIIYWDCGRPARNEREARTDLGYSEIENITARIVEFIDG